MTWHTRWIKAAASVVTLTWLAGCSLYTAPEAMPLSLVVEPNVTSLYVGETVTLKAILTRTDGTKSEVSGAWSAANPSIGILDGQAKGLIAGSSALSVSAAGLTTTVTVEVVPDLRGLWTGTLHHPDCDRRVGVGPSICGKNVDGMRYQFDVQVIEQVGSSIVMNITVSRKATGVMVGTVDRAGEIRLNDTTAVMEGGLFRFNSWRAAFATTPSQSIAGSGQLEREFINAWGPQHYWMAATIELHPA